ncbi:hypothetical protein FRC12_011267 [Ceratobasidium sp. 428]|nr:hypothetical protein FRC12_011267 [Ceratobasidium sp. 428]
MPVSYLITGASKGIGLEFVNQLSLVQDTLVFGLVRNLDTSVKLRDLQSQRKNIHIVTADISNVEELSNAAKQVSSVTGGSLDWLINNAGFIEPLNFFFSFPEYPAEAMAKDMRASYDVNVIGAAQVINAFLPLLRAGKAKKVIALGSGLGDDEFTKQVGLAINGPYSISKYALNLMMLKYSESLKNEGFIFLTISPGVVNTSEGRPSTAEIQAAYMKMFGQFKAVYPDWAGPLTPGESVKQMLDVFSQLKPEHSGNFCSQFGPTSRRWL